MRAKKEDQEQALLGQRALENITEEVYHDEFDIERETNDKYTPYVIPDHIAIFNQRAEEALRLPILNWG